ncbi:MAG: virulence factor SrfB, partial [Rhodoluna sp.]
NVFFRDIDLDNPDYDFPDTTFEVRGAMRLGFRQLDADRWPASQADALRQHVGNDGASILNSRCTSLLNSIP